MSRFKLKERKKEVRLTITLVVVENEMSIKEVSQTESMTSNIIEWQKKKTCSQF